MGEAMNAPQNKHLRIENKNFYFDIKRNQQGRYMSISEVKGTYRNSILIPESGWEDFRNVLDEYVKPGLKFCCVEFCLDFLSVLKFPGSIHCISLTYWHDPSSSVSNIRAFYLKQADRFYFSMIPSAF